MGFRGWIQDPSVVTYAGEQVSQHLQPIRKYLHNQRSAGAQKKAADVSIVANNPPTGPGSALGPFRDQCARPQRLKYREPMQTNEIGGAVWIDANLVFIARRSRFRKPNTCPPAVLSFPRCLLAAGGRTTPGHNLFHVLRARRVYFFRRFVLRCGAWWARAPARFLINDRAPGVFNILRWCSA